MKKTVISIALLCCTIITAQTITGNLSQHQGQVLTLTGFNYYNNYELAKTTIDSLGNFTLNYPKEYKGMGILKTQDNSSLVFILTEPNVQLKGVHLQDINSLSFTSSVANTNFVNYAKTQGLQRNAMSALKYLDNLYQKEQLFTKRKKLKKAIKKELTHIKKQDAAFIAKFDKQSYLRWFIPYKKLVQDMPTIVRKETQRIPEAIAQFRSTDFNHPNFKTSGLFKELIEGHYLLLENMGQPLDSVYAQMDVSTQYLIDNLQENDSLLNTVSNELFNYFEKRSLFKVSEYLSVNLLNNKQCALDDDLATKLESYRRMKVGNIAPDIILADNKKLSDIKKNKLVVFGASWCPHCTKDIPILDKYYQEWKKKNLEIVYISIDTNKENYTKTYQNKPWQTFCDFKGWDTQAAKDYFVTGTPSYYLLDENQKIIARPNGVAHVNVLVEYKL